MKWSAEDVASKVVAHLEMQLADESKPVEPLERSWKVFQGIQTGADAYTARIDKRLSASDRQRLLENGAALGDPILEVPAGDADRPPFVDHPHVLVPSPEPTGILYGAVDSHDATRLVVLRADEPPQAILAHLERWRPLLATRAEIARNPRRRWWETAWPRDPRDMAAPKVIALYRTDRGRFAVDEAGEWQPSIKLTLAVGREPDAPVPYLCGLLNSELLDLWYAVRGKTPWHVRRNYEPKRMNEIPYRRPEGDARAERVAELVRAIAANRRELLPHRAVFPALGRVVKDPWKAGPVQLDRAALVRELPSKETISVRLDPALSLEVHTTPMGRPVRTDAETLAFRRGRKATADIAGPSDRIDLLEELLGSAAPDDLEGMLRPRDLHRFERLARDRSEVVNALLIEGRRLVEEVERLVCDLYEVPDELTEEVVQHAIRRAGTTA